MLESMGGSHRAELTKFDQTFIYGKRKGCHRYADDPTQCQYTDYRLIFYGISEPTILYGSIIECLPSHQHDQLRELHQVHRVYHHRLLCLNYNSVREVQQLMLLVVS